MSGRGRDNGPNVSSGMSGRPVAEAVREPNGGGWPILPDYFPPGAKSLRGNKGSGWPT